MMMMGAGKAKRLNYFGFGTVSRMGDLCRLGGGVFFLKSWVFVTYNCFFDHNILHVERVYVHTGAS